MIAFSWDTTWNAVGALAGLAALYFPLRLLWRKRWWRRPRVFLSMQMSQLTPSEYERVREDIMKLVHELRKTHYVYFFNEFVYHLDRFDEKTINSEEYLSEIRHCDYFIAIVVERICSSIYFEAGYAIAHGKTSIYFAIREDAMPVLMRLISADHPKAKIVKAESLDEISQRVTSALRNIRITN